MKAPSTLLLAGTLVTLTLGAPAEPESIDTRIGKLEFTHDFANGYPTDETVDALFNELDFQRACQTYLWALPLVSMAQWQYAHEQQLGAENGQIILFESYQDKLGGLTYNATTPYALPFINLVEGPWIVIMPKGEVRGAAHDMWQIGITQITEPGKYLFVAPGQDVPEDAEAEGFKVYQSPTNSLLLGIRLMPKEKADRMALLEQIAIYPWSERDAPKPRGFITPDGKPWLAAQPRGMEYWTRLAEIIDREPVFERDRLFLAMLKPLGIEKGKPFTPNDRQTKILTEAALVGEAMAKANDFVKRMEDAHYVDGSQWEFATVSPPDQRREHYDALDGRAAWFYEAVTNDIAMHGQKTGKGQVYLATYKDKDGDWLDGGTNYQLHVPPNAPAKAFWSITLYDVATRCLLVNEHQIADRSSRMDLHPNADGSVTIYMGPDKPEGDAAKNWIPTVAGKAWFPYFRLYSPEKPFLDRRWILPDIEKAN
ncbi:DUF1254 domain-containing protein [Sulfuriroseicoccus oceanibius]|uniref:DUF1254 domain-containing protein n=1 Tax=Sulfuriroseicoccus oceanibius TaxID=2707525 RepID=A0A6B3L9X9_9BACT|nr:DUF1254 domain-containing protein [Sulfuriroseicoccus oceanibius]QQL46086.1 DUF1254 domain-containing protein [Sulfuriroseicoccus oceanibius]